MMAFKNLRRGAALAALLALKVGAVDNGLAITPQMGCEFPLDFQDTLLIRIRG
jgi:alpha-galactosidase